MGGDQVGADRVRAVGVREGSHATPRPIESSAILDRGVPGPRSDPTPQAGRLDEKQRWINVSDGGHIENLATIELLRRRCRYIIVGDAEADPEHHFGGLATLIRSARIDLGIQIDIDVKPLRLGPENLTEGHWAIGRIHYPLEETPGHLLYLKSSISGDEDEVIRQYRSASPSFPHESTADQFFGEGQFEAYRSLGQHIAEQALAEAELGASARAMSFAELEKWFRTLEQRSA